MGIKENCNIRKTGCQQDLPFIKCQFITTTVQRYAYGRTKQNIILRLNWKEYLQRGDATLMHCVNNTQKMRHYSCQIIVHWRLSFTSISNLFSKRVSEREKDQCTIIGLKGAVNWLQKVNRQIAWWYILTSNPVNSSFSRPYMAHISSSFGRSSNFFSCNKAIWEIS